MLLDFVANKKMVISVCNYLEHTYMGKRRTRKNTTLLPLDVESSSNCFGGQRQGVD